MICWMIIYWQTFSIVNLSLVHIYWKIKTMRNYGIVYYPCAPENSEFYCGEKYSLKKWHSNRDEYIIWVFKRRTIQLKQTDPANPSDVLHRICYNNFPKFYFTAHFEWKKSSTLGQDPGNESICYFPAMLVGCCWFFSQLMEHLLKYSGWSMWLKYSYDTSYSGSHVEDTGKRQNNFGPKCKYLGLVGNGLFNSCIITKYYLSVAPNYTNTGQVILSMNSRITEFYALSLAFYRHLHF